MIKIDNYFDKLFDTVTKIDRDSIEHLADAIWSRHVEDKNIFVFGNGGSAATASHFTQDMNKMLKIHVTCLNDNMATITAYANDVKYESVFELQLLRLMKLDDLVIGISCSGNSENVLNAIRYANSSGVATFALTGFNGGKLKKLADYSVHVPCDDMQICEDCHLIISHILIKLLQ